MLRLNLGAGSKPLDGWTNVDIVPLDGIDVVLDLNRKDWPNFLIAQSSALYDEIQAIDVLEHLDDAVNFVTECWKCIKPGGTLFIQTPRYDADFLWTDPSHKRGFTEESMDFFDPTTHYGKTTGFYSPAKFKVSCVTLLNKNLQFTMVAIK